MHAGFSLYLDLVRFVAACLVFLYHTNQRHLVEAILPASHFGHSSVIVFFVLSGFVIAFITDTKEKTPVDYFASRFSRVYSVAVPALLITLVLDFFGRQLAPGIYDYPFDQIPVRMGAGLAMANEIWFSSITTLSNVPFWSICYEWWYYVLFGLVTFFGRRGQWAALLVALVIGPKIVLLAPLWLLGVLLWRWKSLRAIPQAMAWGLLAFSIAGIYAFHYYDFSGVTETWLKGVIGEHWHKQLTFSKFFPSDYLLGILVFMNFAAMQVLAPHAYRLLRHVERPIRWVASFTFTLYLMHQPLFLFWSAVIRGDNRGYLFWWSVTAATVVSVILIGTLTETRRHVLKRFVTTTLERLVARGRERTDAA